MPEFTLHTVETAGVGQPLLESANKAYGFVPNLFAVMAESPALLEGYQTLSAIFDTTSLSETERQIVLMTNNRINGCTYCMAAHTTIMEMQGVSKDVALALRAGTPLADPKLEALRRFAEQVNLSGAWLNESDFEVFFAAGYTQRTALEVILGTGLKVLSNYTNHVANTPLDQAFAKNAWSPAAQIA